MSDLGSHEVSRRGLLRLGLALGISAAVCPLTALGLPESAFAAVAQHPLRLYNPHTRERYDIQLFSGKQFDRLGLIKCDWMMRDWRESQTVKCDRKIYAALYVIQHKFGIRDPISINSGYRSVKTNMALRRRSLAEKGQETWETPAVHSKHCDAQAVDFAVPGVPPREIAAFVESLKIGGTGNYSTFTHMDTASVRRWGPKP